MHPCRTLVLYVAVVSVSPATFADTGPATAFFAYKPASRAVYSVYTEAEPATYAFKPVVIYRLEFDRESKVLEYEQRFEGDFSNYKFLLGRLLVPRSVEFLTPHSFSVTRGGILPLGTAAHEKGAPGAYLHATWYEVYPLMEFPVFEADGMELRRGQEWEFDAPPFLMLSSTVNKLLTGGLDRNALPATKIGSHWRGWESKGGYECAVIDFGFKADAAGETPRGAEKGQYTLKGTSYFSIKLGIPVANDIRADGFVVDEKGKRTEIKLRRKEVLISVGGEFRD